MSKPTWKAESTTPMWATGDAEASRKRPICGNCGWRLAAVVGEGRDVSALAWCVECERAHGGQALPAPRRLPELPTKKKNVDVPKIKDRLAEIGAIPITCSRCGWGLDKCRCTDRTEQAAGS